MGAFSLWQWIVVILIALLLFARPGRIAGLFGEVGKGLRNFRSGMQGDDDKKGKKRVDSAKTGSSSTRHASKAHGSSKESGKNNDADKE